MYIVRYTCNSPCTFTRQRTSKDSFTFIIYYYMLSSLCYVFQHVGDGPARRIDGDSHPVRTENSKGYLKVGTEHQRANATFAGRKGKPSNQVKSPSDPRRLFKSLSIHEAMYVTITDHLVADMIITCMTRPTRVAVAPILSYQSPPDLRD